MNVSVAGLIPYEQAQYIICEVDEGSNIEDIFEAYNIDGVCIVYPRLNELAENELMKKLHHKLIKIKDDTLECDNSVIFTIHHTDEYTYMSGFDAGGSDFATSSVIEVYEKSDYKPIDIIEDAHFDPEIIKEEEPEKYKLIEPIVA